MTFQEMWDEIEEAVGRDVAWEQAGFAPSLGARDCMADFAAAWAAHVRNPNPGNLQREQRMRALHANAMRMFAANAVQCEAEKAARDAGSASTTSLADYVNANQGVAVVAATDRRFKTGARIEFHDRDGRLPKRRKSKKQRRQRQYA